jgi:hypothetical protein
MRSSLATIMTGPKMLFRKPTEPPKKSMVSLYPLCIGDILN